MNRPTKHRTIMHRAPLVQTDLILFEQINDEPGEVTESIRIAADLWRDMGSPGAVTVSVEPSDLLNEPPS